MFGRKRLFLVGMVVFGARLGRLRRGRRRATLIVGRILQGVGAAPMLPLSLAIVCNAFPPREQAAGARDLGGGLGGRAGDRAARRRRPGRPRLAADLLDQPAGRRARDRDRLGRRARVDRSRVRAAGSTCRGWWRLAVGLSAVVLALVQARVWSGGAVVALAVLGAASLCRLLAIEHRVADPIVDFALFRNGPYFGASAAAFALVGAYWAVMFFQPQYLQDVRGHSAIVSGLLILPITVPMVFISPFSARLIARFGARRADDRRDGLRDRRACWFSPRSRRDSSYALLLAGYLPFGVALGLVYAPMSTAAMAAMPREKVGIASGVLAMDRVMAGAIALAVTGAVFHALLEGGDSFAAAIAGSTWVLVALCAVGAPSPGPSSATRTPAHRRSSTLATVTHHL